MDIEAPLPMLGGMSASRFMQRHWQKKPLIMRNTGLDYFTAHLPLDVLIALCAREDVQSRCVTQAKEAGEAWCLSHGPFDATHPLPGRAMPHWTVLVQGVDRVHEPTQALLQRFAFVPYARLDDVMVSFATDGGGVGPHVDSYDVFLLQAHGQRRWRFGHQTNLSLKPGLPLKVLQHFVAEQDVVLNPGDMLYLPPGWAHDGVAIGDCMTVSIGFRAPSRAELLKEFLHRVIDQIDDACADSDDPEGLRLGALYADRSQSAVITPGRIPEDLVHFASESVANSFGLMKASGLLGAKNMTCMLGEYLSESDSLRSELDAELPPKQLARWSMKISQQGLRLCPGTRMLYDDQFVFANGCSWRAAGRDAKLLRKLADLRQLNAQELDHASADVMHLLTLWVVAGWASCSSTQSGAPARRQSSTAKRKKSTSTPTAAS